MLSCTFTLPQCINSRIHVFDSHSLVFPFTRVLVFTYNYTICMYMYSCISHIFMISCSPLLPPSTKKNRHSKPFNPLLGETYELVNQEGSYCVVSEQVSHHPPVTALHAESDSWVFWEEYKLDIKFRGQVRSLSQQSEVSCFHVM